MTYNNYYTVLIKESNISKLEVCFMLSTLAKSPGAWQKREDIYILHYRTRK